MKVNLLRPVAMVFLVGMLSVLVAGTSPAPLPLALRPTNTPVPTSAAPTSTPGGEIAPYPSAPLCPDTGAAHDHSQFHTLWDGARGCHYDNEHGMDPFVPEVAAAFPDFDLLALLGGVEVGHSNPSSPAENVAKHGGFKWDVTLAHTAGCAPAGFAETGVDAFVSQYHNFGDYRVEFEARVHSALALMRQCQPGNPDDKGYVFVVQHLDYGQRLSPYQGTILEYPDTPLPAYNAGLAPYLTITCFGGIPPCAKHLTRQAMINRNANADSTWSSAPAELIGSGSSLFSIVFRLRDTYQALDWNDQSYPYTMPYLCSSDGGATYDPAMPGCRWNNSTSRIHQLAGEIPAAWDNLPGFDTDPRAGRITAEGYVTAFGELVSGGQCQLPGLNCHLIKMVQAFAGEYATGFDLSPLAGSKFDSVNLPERDICFTAGGAQIGCDTPGAVPSGWVGPGN